MVSVDDAFSFEIERLNAPYEVAYVLSTVHFISIANFIFVVAAVILARGETYSWNTSQQFVWKERTSSR